jgi:acyl-CoA dehydrogenase
VTTTSAADRQELRSSLRTAFAALSPSTKVREQMASEDGWDPTLWTRLCQELGLVALAVPEQLGGAGCSWVEQAAVFEEAGAALLCGPLMSTGGLVVPLLLSLGTPQANDLLPQLCEGRRTAALVRGAGEDAAGRLHATPAGDSWLVSGSVPYVVDASTATDLVLVADGPAGLVVVHAPAPTGGLTPLVTLDQTRRQCRVTLTDLRATVLDDGPGAETAVLRALQVSRALLAAEEVGVAQRALDMTVDYARTRIQFGRPIGSFQAVKQKAADMLIRVESARSAAHAAAQSVSTGEPDPAVATTVAAAYCAEAATSVTADTIQLHGGIGFTWEHDAHLYFKRARSNEELLGRPSLHVERLATVLAGR